MNSMYEIKVGLSRAKNLLERMASCKNDNNQTNLAKYSGYKEFATEYNEIAEAMSELDCMDKQRIWVYDLLQFKYKADLTWSSRKSYFDHVYSKVELLILYLTEILDSSKSYKPQVMDEMNSIIDVVKRSLRASFDDAPESEYDVQKTINTILLAAGYRKGSDFDKEDGEFKFSGRGYRPDFVFYKSNLCLEVKLLKNKQGRQSAVEQINADINAYFKKYKQLLVVIYDVCTIQNEAEFIADFEKSHDNVRVIVIKH